MNQNSYDYWKQHFYDESVLCSDKETESLKRMGITKDNFDAIKPENYELIYVGNLSELQEQTEGEMLEAIYEKFNIYHPEDYRGYSLSVSDIVVLHQNGKNSAHFVDSFGFTGLSDFMQTLEGVKEQEAEIDTSGQDVQKSEPEKQELETSDYTLEDGDEIIDLGDVKVDINPITAQRTGKLENYLPQAESYLESTRQEREQELSQQMQAHVEAEKDEVEVTLMVSECSEFHNMGEFYENIPTVEEAIAIWKQIPPERMHGIPAIGINVHRPGEESDMDDEVDLLSGNRI